MRRLSEVLLILAAVGPNGVCGQQPNDAEVNEAAIRKMVASYVDAFNKHDAAALADLWSPDAVYLNRVTGDEVVGRAAIAEQFAELFKEQPELKAEVSVESIQFISPNVAVERGTTRFLDPKSEPEEFEYMAVEVQRDGKWLLDRVTDKEKDNLPSHYEQLKVLEWMVGEWTSDSEDADVELDCNWTKNQSFLTRTFTISIEGEIAASGLQIIGWDPAAKSIRSWTFDANGTFTDGTWEQKGRLWFIRNRGTLPDGRAATMVNVMEQIDADSFTWQTIERTAGDELLPNIDEIQIKRR
ncbi:MAG TPA: SgcJ/EcaC family oxidoreductase [Pirellulales bacterium]|jgi:uncharacterized protein (TIGR02246 family)